MLALPMSGLSPRQRGRLRLPDSYRAQSTTANSGLLMPLAARFLAQDANQSRTNTKYRPPPLGGINDQDGFANMKAGDALRLVNFVPKPDGLHARAGTRLYVDGIDAGVESMFSFAGQRLFAATATAIYEIQQNVKTLISGGMLSGRWTSDMGANEAGPVMMIANGWNAPRAFNGSWSAPTITGADASRSLNPSRLSGVVWHQRRFFFFERGTRNVWYLAPGAFGGAARIMPLDGLFAYGSEIIAIGSLTADAGRNKSDRFVVLTSMGEIAVYSGTDPDNAATWDLDGVWSTDWPSGWRPLAPIGGKLAVTTKTGVYGIPAILGQDKENRQNTALSERIEKSFRRFEPQVTSAHWQVMDCNIEQGSIILNRPNGIPIIQSRTGGWWELGGFPITCWADMGGVVFFGTSDGQVRRYGAGYDDDASPQRPIECLMVDAYWNFGTNSLKHFTRVRPNMTEPKRRVTAAGPEVSFRPRIEIVTDYALPKETYPAGQVGVGGMGWDFPFEGDRPWQAQTPVKQWPWRGIAGRGTTGALVLSVNTRGPFRYEGADVEFTMGSR